GLDGSTRLARAAAWNADREHAVPGCVRGLVEVALDARRPVIRGPGRDEPYRSGAPGHERARRCRRLVPELFDRLAYALPGLVPYVRRIVDHSGDRLMRHPGKARDIEDRRRTVPLSPCHSPRLHPR